MYNFEMNGYLWKQKGVWNSLGIIEMRIAFGKLQVWFHEVTLESREFGFI